MISCMVGACAVSGLIRRIVPSCRARDLVVVAMLAVSWLLTGTAAAEERNLWKLLRSGDHVALLRHALAPGTGDPAEFSLRDCSTQRNLSAGGREQAARIGQRFRANGIDAAAVYSSQWCRCLETAELLALGPVTELPALNSFFQDFGRRDEQTRALNDWLGERKPGQVSVLVTHQVNITALTGVYPASGELVIIRRSDDGTVTVAGTMQTD